MEQRQYKKDMPDGCWKAIAIMAVVAVVFVLIAIFAVWSFLKGLEDSCIGFGCW